MTQLIMSKKGLLSLIGFILLLIAILYGGPYLSDRVYKKYRKKIENNGFVTKAVVYRKKTHKGNTVHFKYQFKDIAYRNNQQNDTLFEQLNTGDVIDILLDSTNPSASYILK